MYVHKSNLILIQWHSAHALSINKTNFITFSYTISSKPVDNTCSTVAHHCLSPRSQACARACGFPRLDSTANIKYSRHTIDQHFNFKQHVVEQTARVRELSLSQIGIFSPLSIVTTLLKTTMINLEKAREQSLKSAISVLSATQPINS